MAVLDMIEARVAPCVTIQIFAMSAELLEISAMQDYKK